MRKGYRQGRLAEEIRKIVSELLLLEIKDPGLSGLVTVTGVEVTADGSLARVFLTVFDEGGSPEQKEQARKDVLAALQRSKGFIRTEIGRQITLRHVPDLSFRFDTSADYGRHIEELLNEVVKKNETE